MTPKSNKTKKELKQLLRKTGASFVLTKNERASLKQSIFEKKGKSSQKHSSSDPIFIVSPYMHYFQPLVGVFALLIVLIPLGLGSHDSLPGDPLYSVKTNVVERIPLMTKLTPTSRADYYSELVRERLEESAELLRRDQYTEDRLVALDEELEENVLRALSNTNKAIERNDVEETLESTSELTAMLRVHKEIARRGGLARPKVDELSQNTQDEHDAHIEEYTTESSEGEITEATSEILEVLEESLNEDAEPGVVEEIKDALLDAHSDIRSNNYRDAYKRLIQSESEVEEREMLKEILETLENDE